MRQRCAFERGQDLRSQLAHAARAEGQNQVAFARLGGNGGDGGGKSGANSTRGP